VIVLHGEGVTRPQESGLSFKGINLVLRLDRKIPGVGSGENAVVSYSDYYASSLRRRSASTRLR
jgi:hypothetical protein